MLSAFTTDDDAAGCATPSSSFHGLDQASMSMQPRSRASTMPPRKCMECQEEVGWKVHVRYPTWLRDSALVCARDLCQITPSSTKSQWLACGSTPKSGRNPAESQSACLCSRPPWSSFVSSISHDDKSDHTGGPARLQSKPSCHPGFDRFGAPRARSQSVLGCRLSQLSLLGAESAM